MYKIKREAEILMGNLMEKFLNANDKVIDVISNLLLSRGFIFTNIIIGVIVIIAFFVLKRTTEIRLLYIFNELTEEDFEAIEQQCENDKRANQMWDDFANKYPDFMGTMPFDFPENRTEEEIDVYLDEEDKVLEEIRVIEKDSDTFWKDRYKKIFKRAVDKKL